MVEFLPLFREVPDGVEIHPGVLLEQSLSMQHELLQVLQHANSAVVEVVLLDHIHHIDVDLFSSYQVQVYFRLLQGVVVDQHFVSDDAQEN